MKESGSILLQTIPDTINIESLRSELLTAFPDIINVHDLHIWRLTGSKVFSTAHIIFLNSKVSASSYKYYSLQYTHIWDGHRLPKPNLFLHKNIFYQHYPLQSSILASTSCHHSKHFVKCIVWNSASTTCKFVCIMVILSLFPFNVILRFWK